MKKNHARQLTLKIFLLRPKKIHTRNLITKKTSCFSRKRRDLSKKKLHAVCTLTKVYQYAKEERFLSFEPCRTLVDICMELLLKSLKTNVIYRFSQG